MQTITEIILLIKFKNMVLLLLLSVIIFVIGFSDFYIRKRLLPLCGLIFLKILINIFLGILIYWNDITVAFIHCCYVIRQEAIDNDNLKTQLYPETLLQPFRAAVKKYISVLQSYLLGQETKPEFDSLRQCLKYLFANVKASITYDYDTEMMSPHVQYFISLTDPYRTPYYKFLFLVIKMREYNITIVDLSLVSKLLTFVIVCYSVYVIVLFVKEISKKLK